MYERRAEIKLSKRQLLVLGTVARHKHSPGLIDCYNHLKRFYHTLSPTLIHSTLLELRDLGLINITTSPVRYELTTSGKNCMLTIEGYIRNIRADK
jgi:Fe2+ or Zn2+ uptake regulation protein